MWSYYGSKTNIAHLYPAPRHGKIIEPFAGTARYSLLHFEKDVLLIDKYDVIVKIWKWLQKCSPNDITSLPRIGEGKNINTFYFDCEEARLLMGFVIGFGSATARHIATPRARHRPNQQNFTLNRIASQLWKIRHWEIRHDSYENIPNEPATWYIDPPYYKGGHCYRFSNKKIDYTHLSGWCRDRQGQVIVCENTHASWLPFKPFTTQNVLSGRNREAIWTNFPTQYDNVQTELNINSE